MKTPAHELSTELEPQASNAVFQRILSAVERNERSRWVEITSAVLLGLATLASAWCAYQATLWSGAQTFHLAKADHAGRKSTEQALAANQIQTYDFLMLLSFIEARSRGDDKLAERLYIRFRPEARTAIDAWLKTDPFNNPNAPLRPFQMKEYVQPEKDAAKVSADEANHLMDSAQTASRNGDTYVLFTVLFTSVLFFGGISGTFESRPLRTTTFVIATGLFGITLVALATMPICKG